MSTMNRNLYWSERLQVSITDIRSEQTLKSAVYIFLSNFRKKYIQTQKIVQKDQLCHVKKLDVNHYYNTSQTKVHIFPIKNN